MLHMKRIHFCTLFLLVFLSSATQTTPAQQLPATIRSYLMNSLGKSGLSEADVQDVAVSSQYIDRASGRSYVYLQQTWKGIPVFNAIASVVWDNGKAYGTRFPFVPGLSSKVNAEIPAITPQQAIYAALAHIEMSAVVTAPSALRGSTRKFIAGIPSLLSSPSEVELLYVKTEKGLRLAWNVTLDLKDGSHWWNIRIDAITGMFIEKNDWVTSCSFNGPHDHSVHSSSDFLIAPHPSPMPGSGTAMYNVFPLPVESPIHGSRQILNDPSEPVPSPYGWHDTNGSAGADFNITRGNNVYAYEDANNDNLPGYSPDGGSLQIFNHPFHIDSAVAYNRNAAITNLFYMSNVLHDILHFAGFNEAAGNFQQINYSGQGQGNDFVNAEALDGGGTNNANFATPPDGQNPRMQMYLWTNTSASSCTYLNVNSPTAIAGLKSIATATYNPAVSFNITGNVVLAQDGVGTSTDGCSAFTNAAAVAGKIALIDRGTCNFVVKTQNAMAAGALAVIIANNVSGSTPPAMSGTPTVTITIPTVSVTQADGNAIKNQLNLPATVNGTISICIPVDRDGDFDNGIIAHEYGHGVSNRLTGGPAVTSCLTNAEQGGEGWSDWLGLITTIEPGDAGGNPRGIGTFAVFEPVSGDGIRRYPYTTNMSINPLTYANMSTSVYPHGRGEIWCSAIWDMTWFLIRDFGFNPNIYTGNAGNNIAMRLVLEGMKLQPCSPGYIDARDAILLADDILYGSAHRCQIWEAFARRGMGYYAAQGNANAVGDETVDFTYPPFCLTPTAPPVAAFNAVQTSGECPASIKFNDQSTSTPQSWFWSFGDGTTSTQQNPTKVYTQPGTYSVKLRVTNTLGADSVTLSNLITITSFTVTATSTSSVICAGDSVQLGASVTGSTGISGYNLSTIPYAPVSGTGTLVSLADDAMSNALPIGFTFRFFENQYSSFYISSNGFITFSANQPDGCCVGQSIPNNALPTNLIAFAWNDLNPSVNASTIRYFTDGTAPNRRLIVSYNTNHYNGTTFPMRGQIILLEGTNLIEIHSEVITAVSGNPTTQGIQNLAGNAAYSPSGRNAVVFGIANDAVRYAPFTTLLYSWTPSGGLTDSSIAAPGAKPQFRTTYKVSVSAPNGCVVTQTVSVNVILCANSALLQLGVLIEGFVSGAGTMTPALYNSGMSADPLAVDSVLIELRAPGAPATVAYSASAILNSNGEAQAEFPPGVYGKCYFVVVKHRNGLETWSKTPIQMLAVNAYNFKNP